MALIQPNPITLESFELLRLPELTFQLNKTLTARHNTTRAYHNMVTLISHYRGLCLIGHSLRNPGCVPLCTRGLHMGGPPRLSFSTGHTARKAQ